jgi:hypothetical protein
MYFIILFCQSGLRQAANRVLERMEHCAAKADPEDLQIRASMQFSRATYLRSFQPDPYGQITAAQQADAAYRQIGNLREAFVCGTFIGEMQAEAGDLAAGEATLRDTLALAIRLKQQNLITSGYLHLASALVRHEDLKALTEAQDLLKKVLEVRGLSIGFRGWAHGIQAQILLLEASYEAAEVEAKRAVELSHVAPLRRLISLACLVKILLLRQHLKEAQFLAEEGLKQAESLGGGGYSGLPLILAVAEARYAVGDKDGAAAALHMAHNELQRRSALILDPVARKMYVANIKEHARILELAQA